MSDAQIEREGEREDGPLMTHVGRALWAEHLLFGKNMYRDIVPLGAVQLLPLFIGGITLPPAEAEVFSRFCVCTCITDPHIWPLKIARLGSSYGRMVPGVVTGALLQESSRIGAAPTSGSAHWLLALIAEVGADPSDAVLFERLEHIITTQKLLPGFGVPFRDVDERVEAVRRVVNEAGFENRPHWKLFVRVAHWIALNKRIAPNLASATAALLLDLGFAPDDTGTVIFILVLLTQFANAVEGAKQAPRLMRALGEETVVYAGEPPRLSSRA